MSYISGVFLSFNEVPIPNDGYVLASDFGSLLGSLLCNTDRSGCCRTGAQGNWYLPNGTVVGGYSQLIITNPGGNFFARNRDDTGIVRLYTVGSPTERGRFRCEIPNASGSTETRYVNIGEWSLYPYGYVADRPF